MFACCLDLQVPQDVLQKLLESLQENHYQEDEQFLGAVMPRLGTYDLFLYTVSSEWKRKKSKSQNCMSVLSKCWFAIKCLSLKLWPLVGEQLQLFIY